jgi:hypothetical protein
MSSNKILFTSDGKAITPTKIRDKIAHFGDSYIDATQKIIQYSGKLDRDGEVFIKCASLILSNFGMTRSGPFKKGVNKKILPDCWSKIGGHLIAINKLILKSGCSRDRLLLELDQQQLEELIAEIWLVMKQLLPFTMGKTTYGLVGASKILFAVLPEIVLPIDNKQWLHVFKTVDIGDVINQMVSEIKHWEKTTGKKLNEMDLSKRLTTLPSVYNVMAMAARPD